MDGVDSDFEELFADFLCGHHSGVRRGFFSVTRDLHSAGDSAESFSSRKVGDVNEGVVPCGHDVGDSNDWFVFLGYLWSIGLYSLVLLFVDFLVHDLRFIIL